jgi:integrase
MARKKGEKYEKIAILSTNGGYRIEDVLFLKKKNIWDGSRVVFRILEKKTKIKRSLPKQILEALENIFSKYLEQFEMDDYIFPSSRKDNSGKKKHISYNRVYKVFKEIFGTVNIRGAKGTHTFRKTFAENSRKHNKGDIRTVQKDLGHKSIKSTESYLDDTTDSKIKPWI